MLGSDGTTWETQSSAFTEELKTQIGNLADTVDLHTTQIYTLKTKTQWQTASSDATVFSTRIKVPNGNIGYPQMTFIFNQI